MESGVAIVAALVVLFALVSRRIDGTVVTPPMLFVAAGLLVGPEVLDVVELDLGNEALRLLAEYTLVIVLFSDAARIDLGTLRRYARLPARLLGIGMPLTIAAGTLAGWLLFDFSVWEAALLAAVLAPTDAALGQVVVSDHRVPIRIRQGLNVESGVNDGIAVPFVTLFVALAIDADDVAGAPFWLRFVAEQIGYGALVGVAVGTLGGLLVDRFTTNGWMSHTFQQIGVVALAVLSFAAATAIDGNGFIAAFLAGLCVGNVTRDVCDGLYEFAEEEGQVLSLLTFLIFGGVAVGASLDELTWQIAAYVVLSLTLVRMIPVALGLIGLHFERPTVGYLGWFGPRGLASIIFALVVVEEAEGTVFAEEILVIVTWTVLISVVLHGVTAAPLTTAYARWVDSMMDEPGADDMGEMQPVEPLPTRWWRGSGGRTG